MIPPVGPGQNDPSKQHNSPWKNTFNMRQLNLKKTTNSRRSYYVSPNGPKSLDLLRKNLQSAINKDVDAVIRKYLDKFFQPAVSNIKMNLGADSVTEQDLREVCRQMLENAKQMYTTESLTGKRENSSSSSSSSFCLDVDSQPTVKRLKTKQQQPLIDNNMGCKFSLKRDGPKWNPARIKTDTKFIMGSRANKVLGYGQTRGRLYVRHPNLLRYCGDQEDKEWLQAENLLPANGGKIYIMLLEDIQELTESDEYRHNLNLQLHELHGFEAPGFMIEKIRNFLEYIRSEKKLMAVLDLDETAPSVGGVVITNELDRWRISHQRQQQDYPNMSSDMSSLSSSVISSILAGTYGKGDGGDK